MARSARLSSRFSARGFVIRLRPGLLGRPWQDPVERIISIRLAGRSRLGVGRGGQRVASLQLPREHGVLVGTHLVPS